MKNKPMHTTSPFALFITLLVLLLNITTTNGQINTNIADITKELEKVYELDQGTRQKLIEAQQTYGHGTNEFKERLQEMSAQDSINREIVFNIIDKHGWIGKTSSSEKASKAIFYVIQHADLAAQRKYKELVEQAFADHEISGVEWGIFEDRLNSRLGKFQLYGSQTAIDNIGNSYLYPVDNIDSVNIRRSAIGFENLSQQLQRSSIKHVFPSQKDPQYDIILIGHFWRAPNIGVSGISVWHDNQHIGDTDVNGFLFTKYSFLHHDTITLTIKEGSKVLSQISLNKGQDFYEIWRQVQPNSSTK